MSCKVFVKIKWKLYGQNGKIYQYSFQINVKFYSVIQIQIMFFRTDSGCLEITTFSLNCDDFTFFLWNFFSISNGNWNFHIFFFHFNLAVLFVSAISLQVYFVDGAHKSNKKDGKDASDKKKRQDKHSSQKDRDKEARKLLT